MIAFLLKHREVDVFFFKVTAWIAVQFGASVRVSLGINYNNFGDPLAFPLDSRVHILKCPVLGIMTKYLAWNI